MWKNRFEGNMRFLRKNAIIHVGFGVLFLACVVALVLTSIIDPVLFASVLEAIERIIDAFTP